MKHMTKMALAAAVAATVSAGANAVAVTGEVTAMQMTLGTVDILAGAGSVFNGLVIGGDTVTGLTLDGNMVAFTAGTYVGIDWSLTDGMRQGVNGAGGTIFMGGDIKISTSTDGVNYTAFDTVDASVTNLPFLAGVNGHIAPMPTQTTAGFVVDDAGYGTLPGLWDLAFFGDGFNDAAGTLQLFGNASGLWMEGSITPVPVPAAAWLFGSALLGLAGIGRSRKAA